MLKAFLRDSVVYGLIRIITSGTTLILFPLYIKVLTPTDYGVVDFLTILSAFVYKTMALEIAQGFVRYLAGATDKKQKILYASTTLWFTLGAYTIFLIISLLFSSDLSNLFLNSLEYSHILQVVALSIWGYGLFYLVQNQLCYDLRPFRYAVVNLSFSIVSIAMTAILLIVFKLGLAGVFLAQLSGNIVGAAIGLYLARDSYRCVFDWGKCKEMLRFSLPLVLSGLGVFGASFADRIAIKKMMSLKDLGVYASGYRIASLVTLAMTGFQLALTPLIYSHYRKDSTPIDIERIFRFFLVMTLPLVLLVSLFGNDVLSLMTTTYYSEAQQVIFLLGTAILFSNMYMFAPGVWIANKTGWIAAINFGAAGLNIALNFTLIPLLKIQGAALATCVSGLGAFLGYTILGQKLYPIPYRWNRIILAMCIVLAIGASTVRSDNFWLTKYDFFSFLFKGIVLIFSSITVALILLERNEIDLFLRTLRNKLKIMR